MSYAVRRVLGVIPVLLLVTVAVFSVLRLVPGDPARLLAGPGVPLANVEILRHQMGLDQPLPQQYLTWLGSILQGDFGRSIATRQPVLPQLLQRFSNSLQLALVGMGLAVVLGVPLGVLAARKVDSTIDVIVTGIASIGLSIPIFWIGILLMLVFSVRLGWLPATGKQGPASFILPGLTIASYATAYIARMTRASMVEALSQPYITTAHAKGLSQRRVLYVHALRNALMPVVTVIFVQIGYLLGGAVLTETVFVWPGIGTLVLEAISRRDLAVVQGGVLLMALSFLFLNLLADILYTFLDPRLHKR